MPITPCESRGLWVVFWRNQMPMKDMGLKKKNLGAPMSKEYRKGGKLYMGGGGTEVGKEAKSYKEYVKKMYGGGMTSSENKEELASIKKKIADKNATKNEINIEKQIQKEKIDKFRSDKAYKDSVRQYGRRALRGDTEKNISDKLDDHIGESSIDKARRKARKDVLGYKKGGKVKR